MTTMAASVQWGKGRHYFIIMEEVNNDNAAGMLGEFAFIHQERQNKLWNQRGRKGAKPVVRVWELVKEYQGPK